MRDGGHAYAVGCASQPHRDGIGDGLHAFAERKALGDVLGGLWVIAALARTQDLTLDQAPVLLLERVQARKGGRHRDALGVACVDAGDERVDRVVEELVAQPAAHECGYRLLDLGRQGLDERLA